MNNVVATSGAKSFADFSTPTPYSDAINPGNPLFSGQQGFVCIRLNDVDINNAPGTTYRVEVSYLLTTPNFAVFDDLSIGNAAPIPLPVTFLGLVANRNGNSVSIRWDVADEANVRQYQIERSTNGSNFTVAGSMQPNGKSVYLFADTYSDKGTVYYRVRNVDGDGRSKYSGIIKLKGSTSFGTALKAYPLPAANVITVEHQKINGAGKITINSLEGRTFKTVKPVTGSSHTPVDLSGLSSGVYVIKLQNGDSETESIKIVKQ